MKSPSRNPLQKPSGLRENRRALADWTARARCLFRRRRHVEPVVRHRPRDVSERGKPAVRQTARADGRRENLLRVPRGADRRRIGHNPHLQRDDVDDQFPEQAGHEVRPQRVLRRALRSEAAVFVLRGPRDPQHRAGSERKWPDLTKQTETRGV